MGTPTQGYAEDGKLIWDRELDSYGKIRMVKGEEGFCNYLYQGQTLDAETGLAYNRFRYYSPEEGMYISQDPIGIESGQGNFYAYVSDPNAWLDPLGLKKYAGNAKAAYEKARKLALKKAAKIRKQAKKNGTNHPTVVTVVVHVKTGKAYTGMSGDRPGQVHKNLEGVLPSESKQKWPVNNCGEVSAYDKALKDNPGSTVSDYREVSVDVRDGSIKKPCKNCRIWVP